MVGEHAESFAGLAVVNFVPEEKPSVTRQACRIAVSWEEHEGDITWPDRLDAYLKHPASGDTRALVVGCWGGCAEGQDSSAVVEALVAAREKLPNLTALFFGDITYEESEISWINQSDLSPLFAAYPDLECLWVRGGQGLSLGTLRLPRLKELRVQTGGLPVSVVREVAGATLPELEHLELWLGTANYGWDGSLDDVQPFLSGQLFPKLRYLGLKNSEIQDEIAVAAATAPITDRLETLDLSMGVLSDKGAAALLASPAVKRLKKLDLHHHYLGADTVRKLERLGPDVDLSDPQDAVAEEDRYVEVGE